MPSSRGMVRSSFHTCREHMTGVAMSNRLAIPSLVVALSVSAAGASLRFGPDDLVTMVIDTNDASSVRPREIRHTRDALDGIWAVGDRATQRAPDVDCRDCDWSQSRGTGPRTVDGDLWQDRRDYTRPADERFSRPALLREVRSARVSGFGHRGRGDLDEAPVRGRLSRT